MNLEDIIFGFEYQKVFYKIGDEIDVFFPNGAHYDGTLENIHVGDREITVEGFVFSLAEIEKIIHIN